MCVSDCCQGLYGETEGEGITNVLYNKSYKFQHEIK